ncbi:hypothetical protein E2C01_037879 [Portunus trituberculatus]|uniref:Integrase zinc-binding domain-containing protein n=1 Tax=Portunus trituberculatus TaxID=210409 RepID=A0A5B7FGG8_PORTR|nr:hypothetical protein [Portunus trituberculatus]
MTMEAILGDDPEVKKETGALMASASQKEEALDKLWGRYSSWYRLLKGAAWLRRFVAWQSDKVEEMEATKSAVLKCVQRRYFPEELKVLRQGQRLRHSPINQLEPYLDTEGLIRVGGQLRRATLHQDQQNPILLPKEGKITELIVRETHEAKAHHLGREYTLARICESYWILNCRKVLDQILCTCVICRRYNWKPNKGRQADLPEVQVRSGALAFTYTGIDCFGPFMVKQGRAQVKRWACIFVCLTIRAVHMEVLATLSADSFIEALMRFTARRRLPKHIRSDNGTNMIGACRELRDAVTSWGKDGKIREALLVNQVE